jgi:hypothetical protein
VLTTSDRSVLGAYFLNERLGTLGKIGCSTCLIGSVIIVLHAPPDKDIKTIDEMLHYAIQLPFLIYCTIVSVFSVVMIYRIAPKYGKKNPLIYISICSTVGSVSIMAVKAFGIALKLTLGGNNQFTHPSTYVFAIIVVVCILTQMNYFNKALATFSTNLSVYFSMLHSMLLTCMRQGQPNLLRHLHHCHPPRVFHPLPWLQHRRRCQHHLAALWLPRHLFRCIPPQSLPRRSRRSSSAWFWKPQSAVTWRI